MKRWPATLLMFAFCSAVAQAEVTIVQKTTVEGAATAMTPGGVPSPVVTTRIKGLMGRSDMDSTNPPANMSAISDAAAKRVTILDHTQKTARVTTAAEKPAAPPAAPGATVKADSAKVVPTGKSQTIDGFACDEFSFEAAMDISAIGGGSVPPEAAAMLKDLTMVMKGSLWATRDAPGVKEYRDYQKAMNAAGLTAAALAASGLKMPAMDNLTKVMQGIDGLSVLTEMNVTVEGTGPIADMMRQMGAMRITTKLVSIKTDAIADDVFQVPEGYAVVK